MSALLELCPAHWVRPEKVTAITKTRTPKPLDPDEMYRITLYISGRPRVVWEFTDPDGAEAWANALAAKINGAGVETEPEP